MPYLSLPGTPGSFASSAYRSEYNDANVIDARIDFNYSVFGTKALVNRWTPDVNRSFTFKMAGGPPFNFPRMAVYSSTNTFEEITGDVTLQSVGIVPGERWQLRAHIDLTVPELRFHYRAPGADLGLDTGWTQLGSTATPTTVALKQPGATGIHVGAEYPDGSLIIATGNVYRAMVKTSAGIVFDADFEDPTTWVYA